MLSDLRSAFRQISKAPGFTAIIVLTLALSIGACTAIYSALDIVLHPYDDPATERNVHLRSIKLPQRVEGNLSLQDFLDLEKQATSFEFMAAGPSREVDLTGTGEPLRLRRAVTTLRYFDLLGVKVTLGRAFLPEEFVAGKGDVVVLSYPCWQRVFGGTPDIVGRIVQINEKPHTVVGVVSERQERTGNNVDMWSPWTDFSEARYPRDSRDIGVAGARLRSGVTIAQAQAELDVIAAALAQKYPATNSNYGLLALSHTPSQRAMIPIVQILFGSVVCLMLIACANVASLLLVRANARQKEMSVRAALGASRRRLIRQLLTEHILVALLGGAAGVLLAQWALDFIRSSIPTGTMNLIAASQGVGSTSLRRLAHLELDGRVLAFALGLSVVTALVFGLAPAWLSSSANLNEALKQGTRGSSEGRSHGRLRVTLVVVEIAIAFTLLACSGLLIRSFVKLAACDPGFDPKQVAFVELNLSGTRYANPAQKVAFADALLDRLRNRVEVTAVGLTTFFPLSGIFGRASTGFEIEGEVTLPVADRPLAWNIAVSPDYFRTLDIPLKQGRFFSESDDAKAPRVVIINQTLARQHFPNTEPIGKRILLGNSPEDRRVIVGVVGDIAHAAFGEAQPAQFYEPVAQGGRFGIVVVRGPGDPAGFPAIIKKEVQTLDPNLPVGNMSTAEAFLRVNLTIMRLTLHLLTAFAVIALLIATIGIYGVVAFSVSQRTVEIGIRMALGAQKHDVLRMILRQGAWLVGIGVTMGLGGAFLAGRAMESRLYNTDGRDPVALAGMAVFFALVAALACWLPARRATNVDPIVALRAE